MRNNPTNVALLHMVLPDILKVEIGKSDDGGLYAIVRNLPGCYTQAGNFYELIEMVNDAVFSYFEVPEPIRDKFGFYIPDEVKRRMEKYQMKNDAPAPERLFENSFNEILKETNTVEFAKSL